MQWPCPHSEATGNILFVYGTLKRGYTNYQRYLNVAERHNKAEFLGTAVTREKFPLVLRPVTMLPDTCAPILMDQAGTGCCIHGEVFRVDSDTLAAMDILEGVRVAKGRYHKREVVVSPPNGSASTEDLRCTAFFFPASAELLKLPSMPSYDDNQHALYRPGTVRPEIVDLCLGLHKHSLSSKQPCPMSVLPVRLLPGDDIVKSLRAFVLERNLDAAIVLTCVGSTSKTTLRPAGVPKGKVFDGKFEIVSLTGTLSSTGHHLHMSISDPDCAVFGGHMLEGCIVRTTAEIVLGVVHDVQFTRPTDPRTGYDELSIDDASASQRIMTSTIDDAKRRRLDKDASQA